MKFIIIWSSCLFILFIIYTHKHTQTQTHTHIFTHKMGADGGIRYLSYTPMTLKTELLEMLKDWLYSDECPFKFDGLIFVKDNRIMIVPDEDTSDEFATPLFTDEQLSFIPELQDKIVDHFTSNQSIPSDHSDNILTREEFDRIGDSLLNFDGEDYEYYECEKLTNEINEVWEAGFLWLYWDTEGYHYCEPFSGPEGQTELKKLFETCSTNDTFKQIFTNFEQFSSFVYTLPETEYIQTWT